MPTEKKQLKRRVLSAVIILLAAYLWFNGQSVRANHARTLQWPETTGKLIMAEYRETKIRRKTRKYLSVRYSYNVDGQTFLNTRVSYAEVRNKEMYANKYANGEPVSVKYDPENPQDSVLEIGAPVSTTKSIIFVALLGAWGSALLIRSFSKSQPSPDS